jgi:uncharacterized protein (TIGR03435 family)
MLQAMLEERFALKTHVETRDMGIYNLVLYKSNPKIKRSADQTPPPPPTTPYSLDALPRGGAGITGEPEGMRAVGSAVPIASLVQFLQMHVDRRIIDKTGLSGLFDFDLRFTPESALTRTAVNDSSFPSVFTALQEQLDLKLETTKGPVRVLAIDSVEMPTEN